MNLTEELKSRATAEGWMSLPAYYEEGREESLSHGSLYSAANELANELYTVGIGRGGPSTIAISIGDRLEWPVAFLACASLGQVAALVNPDLSASSVAEQLRIAEADYVLQSHGRWITCTNTETSNVVLTWSLSETKSRQGATRKSDYPMIDSFVAEPPLYIQFTSGTTGEFKGIFHSAGDLEMFFQGVGKDMLNIQPKDRILSVSQFYFTYGFNNQFVYPLLSGCSVLLRPARRSAQATVDAIETFLPSLLFSVPSALAVLPPVVPSFENQRSPLRAVVSAGEKLPAHVRESVERAIHTPVLEQIGCTEVGNAFCADGIYDQLSGTCGKACEGTEVEIRPRPAGVSEMGDEHLGSQAGEVWVRSKTIPKFAATTRGPVQLTDEENWFFTGDLGYWSDNGGFVAIGRVDEILQVGGISVSAVRIEQAILRSSSAADVAVASVCTKEGKSKLVALYVPDDEGSTRLDRGEIDLKEFCQVELERYEVPRHFFEVEEIPRTPSGKIQRVQVTEQARLRHGTTFGGSGR